MTIKGPRKPVTLTDDTRVQVDLSRGERWLGLVVVTVVATLSSVATGAVVYGKMSQRLEQVEQKQAQLQADHDTLTRLDERVAWLCARLGKKD